MGVLLISTLFVGIDCQLSSDTTWVPTSDPTIDPTSDPTSKPTKTTTWVPTSDPTSDTTSVTTDDLPTTTSGSPSWRDGLFVRTFAMTMFMWIAMAFLG